MKVEKSEDIIIGPLILLSPPEYYFERLVKSVSVRYISSLVLSKQM